MVTDNKTRDETNYHNTDSLTYRTEQKVYFHINTIFTNICDRVIIDS